MDIYISKFYVGRGKEKIKWGERREIKRDRARERKRDEKEMRKR